MARGEETSGAATGTHSNYNRRRAQTQQRHYGNMFFFGFHHYYNTVFVGSICMRLKVYEN